MPESYAPTTEPDTPETWREPTLPARRFRRRMPLGGLPTLGLETIAEGEGRKVVKDRDALYRRMLAMADVLAAGLALVVAVGLIGHDRLELAGLAVLPIVVVLSKIIGLYDRDELLLHKTTLDEAPKLFQLATLYALLTFLAEDLLVDGAVGKKQVLGLWAAFFVFGLISRRLARGLANRSAAIERCILVGDYASYLRFREKLRHGGRCHAHLIGRVPLEGDSNGHGRREVLGHLDGLETLVAGHDISRVIIAPHDADTEGTLDLVRKVKSLGVRVSILPRIFEVVGSSVEFDNVEGVTLLGVRRFGLTRSSRVLKRGLDLVGATAALLATGPLMAIIALAIRLDSPGPLFFRQVRVGRDGEVFEMLKFRTMVDGADAQKEALRVHNEAAEGLFKIAEDPRITRVGRFLRRTSLDELPQLINVLRGQMSLVGPRPLVVDEDRRVEGWHRRRLHLTPGMTGHWQILGSSRVPLNEMVKIDYLYVANWSLWTDVKILVRTVPYMFSQRGL